MLITLHCYSSEYGIVKLCLKQKKIKKLARKPSTCTLRPAVIYYSRLCTKLAHVKRMIQTIPEAGF